MLLGLDSMARRKHNLSNASANHRRKKVKKISFLSKQHRDDLEDKFSRMSITPSSKSMLSRVLLKRTQSVKPTPKDVTKAANELEQRRLEPLVPPVIYYLLQDIIVWIGLAETHKDDFYYQLQLEGLEATVHQMASVFASHMTRDWKYDRATVGKWGRIPDYFTAYAYTS